MLATEFEMKICAQIPELLGINLDRRSQDDTRYVSVYAKLPYENTGFDTVL